MGVSIVIATAAAIIVLVAMRIEARVSYKNFKVYRIYPNTNQQVQFLQALEENYEYVSIYDNLKWINF